MKVQYQQAKDIQKLQHLVNVPTIDITKANKINVTILVKTYIQYYII